ncbi:unnamed protein product [Durusdinium trenchii]|uniref:J domain-containing protein n=1 Tax=Durusdinium trenchii TaxID=1381693 RepID=A0ABP0N640_9DINO
MFASLFLSLGRFGNNCRSWLLGPHVGVKQDLSSLQASDFLAALRSLVEQADVASRMPIEERHRRLAGRDSPSASVLLEELQSIAVHSYKHLARWSVSESGEERSRIHGAVALAFQHEALIVLTDKDWAKPKRLKTHEAFWDVSPDLASSKAAKLALKGRLPSDDLDLLKAFFVDAVGIPERLTQQDLEARLRVPLSQEPQQQSSWQEGFGLQDFEDFATVRRGPGILRPGEGEEDFFRPADNLTGGAGGAGTTGDAGASFGSERYSQDPQGTDAGGSRGSGDSMGPSSTESPSRPDVQREEGEEREGQEAPSSSSAMPSRIDSIPEQPETVQEEQEELEEEDTFDWDGEDANDPYKVLRVDKDANDETIKRSYKKLALKYHPDKNRGSEIAQKRFQAIAAAYETLRDPEKRRAYDKAAAKKESASREEEDRPPQPKWEPKVSVEQAREMFRSFFGDRPTAEPEASKPTARRKAADSPDVSTPDRSGKTQIRKLSKEEYNNLLSELKEAEETAKMWHEEVEAAREQLQEAEATRDRYLRILQECYDRSRTQLAHSQSIGLSGLEGAFVAAGWLGIQFPELRRVAQKKQQKLDRAATKIQRPVHDTSSLSC